MDWLKTIAPWLATALGGPLGGLAVEAATRVLGVEEKTAEGLKNALAGISQEHILALKKADQEFSLQMQALGFKQITDLEALTVGDRKDARELQKSVRSKIPATLSIIVTVGYFGILIGMMFGLLKVSDSQALLLMLGSLTTGWGAVLAYWFGSTSSSATKTELIARAPAVQ